MEPPAILRADPPELVTPLITRDKDISQPITSVEDLGK
jgi:hypothetical protein